MAPSFSSAKIVSSFIADAVSPVITRRGYAAASRAAAAAATNARRGGAPNMMLTKGIDESAETSWVPDLVTGYYRPENQAEEIDAAELRALLLKNTNRRR